MNRKFFIRFERPTGRSWAVALDHINIYAESLRTVDRDSATIRDHSQHVSYNTRTPRKSVIFKTYVPDSKNFLCIGYPLKIQNQKISIAEVDQELIADTLSKPEFTSIYFAFFIGDNPAGAGDLDVIDKSAYYARNNVTGKFVRLADGSEIDGNYLPFTFWYKVEQIKNSEIFNLTVNAEVCGIYGDIDGTWDNYDFKVLGVDDESFSKSIFRPSIRSGGTIIGENLIFSNSDTLAIDTTGNSIIHGYGDQKVPDHELPKMELSVESSVPYTINNNVITLDISNTHNAYIKYRWITGTDMDLLSSVSSETPAKAFVIIKK